MIIINKILVRILSLGFISRGGITIFPFIILTHKGLKRNKELMNHEFHHLYYQAMILVIPWLVIYILNFLLLLPFCIIAGILNKENPIQMAYERLIFEKLARANERKYPLFPKKKWYMNWFDNYK